MKNRVHYDLAGEDYQSHNKAVNVFPKYSKVCGEAFSERISNNCYTGIRKWDIFGRIGNQNITSSNIGHIFRKYSAREILGEIYDQVKSEDLASLKNPGVEVDIVYSNHLNTDGKLIYNKSPRENVRSGKGYPPDKVEYIPGDGDVPTSSALIAGVKWADDFNKGLKGSKPVALIEMCSKMARRDKMVDKKR